MPKNLLIIITGLPGTGKTTLAKKLAKKFNLPLLCRDEIKEMLFDNLGWKDREWSKKIGKSSYAIFYFFIKFLLKINASFIIETNFDPKFANIKFNELTKKYNFSSLQIRCTTDKKILFERFKKGPDQPSAILVMLKETT